MCSWCKVWQRLVISGLLIIGLNQNLLLSLAVSQQKTKPELVAVACACPPTACTCSPMAGCEHSHPGKSGQKEQINVCHLNSSGHQAISPFSVGWELPTLTHRLASLTPHPSFTYLDLLPANSVSQQYLTPPDKPPQSLV